MLFWRDRSRWRATPWQRARPRPGQQRPRARKAEEKAKRGARKSLNLNPGGPSRSSSIAPAETILRRASLFGTHAPRDKENSPAAFCRGALRCGVRPTAPRSPWQNGYCERAIGSIRRECLDHVVVFGERHLHHLLRSYATYYNSARTHLSINKDAPSPRTVHAVGRILPTPFLGGLHHLYVRI